MLRAVRDTVWSGLRTVSDTPLNRPIGTHRRFDWLEMSLDDVKAVKNRLGGTLNDVVLTTVTGAMQRFLEERRVNVEGLDFRVMAPVSVRASEERGTLGNRVSAWVVDLPLAERDPRRRLEQISESTTQLKDSKQALGAEMLTQVMSWTPSTLLSLGSRMVMRAAAVQPGGDQRPGTAGAALLLGARMLDNFGQVPADRLPRARHRALQLRRQAVLGLHRRLGPGARSARGREGDRGRIRGAARRRCRAESRRVRRRRAAAAPRRSHRGDDRSRRKRLNFTEITADTAGEFD